MAKGDSDFVLERSGARIVYVIECKYNQSPILSKRETFHYNQEHQSPSSGSIALGSDVDPERIKEKSRVVLDADLSKNDRTEENKFKVQRTLEKNIEDAFSQIHRLGYAKAFLKQNKTVYAVAIAIVGKGDVKIDFREILPSDFT